MLTCVLVMSFDLAGRYLCIEFFTLLINKAFCIVYYYYYYCGSLLSHYCDALPLLSIYNGSLRKNSGWRLLCDALPRQCCYSALLIILAPIEEK